MYLVLVLKFYMLVFKEILIIGFVFFVCIKYDVIFFSLAYSCFFGCVVKCYDCTISISR